MRYFTYKCVKAARAHKAGRGRPCRIVHHLVIKWRDSACVDVASAKRSLAAYNLNSWVPALLRSSRRHRQASVSLKGQNKAVDGRRPFELRHSGEIYPYQNGSRSHCGYALKYLFAAVVTYKLIEAWPSDLASSCGRHQ